MFRSGLRQPAQQCTKAGAFQDLFNRPQAIGRFLRLDNQYLFEVDAQLHERRGKDKMRWRQQDDGFTGLRQCVQHGRQQAEFTAAMLRPKQFGKHGRRPAAARKLAIEPGMTGRNARCRMAAQCVAAPEYMRQGSGQRICLGAPLRKR